MPLRQVSQIQQAGAMRIGTRFQPEVTAEGGIRLLTLIRDRSFELLVAKCRDRNDSDAADDNKESCYPLRERCHRLRGFCLTSMPRPLGLHEVLQVVP